MLLVTSEEWFADRDLTQSPPGPGGSGSRACGSRTEHDSRSGPSAGIWDSGPARSPRGCPPITADQLALKDRRPVATGARREPSSPTPLKSETTSVIAAKGTAHPHMPRGSIPLSHPPGEPRGRSVPTIGIQVNAWNLQLTRRVDRGRH